MGFSFLGVSVLGGVKAQGEGRAVLPPPICGDYKGFSGGTSRYRQTDGRCCANLHGAQDSFVGFKTFFDFVLFFVFLFFLVFLFFFFFLIFVSIF